MKIKVLLSLTLAGLLGLGSGYFLRNDVSSERPNVMLRSADYSAIQSRVNSSVVIYSIATCAACQAAKALLDKHAIAYVELPIDQASASAEAKALGASRVPFILIGNHSIEGFDQQQLLKLLDQQDLLAQAL